MKYFYINNIKFNYTLEFNNNFKADAWKHNAPLIEYCETLGINIPHYCYHKNLSISGNCRMCLIELKGSPKPIVSCAMSAKSCLNNGEIYTNSPLVKKARENILEFLLLNHPLDCPICDQGGECDLQDQSFFFGLAKKRFYSFKRVVSDKNIGPIVKTVMTRCIHCTRCVRFAGEIAGVEDLGVFGRGMQSEIGTYVNKVFQSELSGNVIDLCPVGALTSKPYPFIGRNWELKNVNSIDFSDGFGVDLQICLKNNKIVKILPGYNQDDNTVNWISDKTRFAFDGMFSPERILRGFVIKGSSQNLLPLSWKDLFEEIAYILYFQDHLARHFLKTNLLTIIFSNNVSNEVLNLLTLLSKKYSFVQLRKSEPSNIETDLESKFLLNSASNKYQLAQSKVCFLIGLNTRYEGSSLNLKLRHRYLKGDFKVIALGSAINLTFPISYLGLNLKTLTSVIEGNNFFCQELANGSNPTIICGSELFKRKDALTTSKLLNLLKKYLQSIDQEWSNINILNTSLNESGVHYVNTFKYFSEQDFQKSVGLYFIDTCRNIPNLRKTIQYHLLNRFRKEKSEVSFYLDQNGGLVNQLFNDIKKISGIYSYVNLPNNVFFETSGSYLNTEGVLKQTIKFIPSHKQARENWQIIRKLLSSSNFLSFLSEMKTNERVNFNCENIFNFKNFINFQYYAIQDLTNSNFLTTNRRTSYFDLTQGQYKTRQSKLIESKVRLWLDDFYIGSRDMYARRSITMIKCSKLFRTQNNNFNFI
uniref:Complex I-75kD n=1 Tax=Minutocellus polymorphus TaxID=265543 RepID=A0A8A6KRB0_9STRA|nr:NADH dehydrogenase subunit 11 [Minutocellus polymorphus]QTI83139.1 NADH dehydrogenase subunit 11 [Minutocellus polymorphus]